MHPTGEPRSDVPSSEVAARSGSAPPVPDGGEPEPKSESDPTITFRPVRAVSSQ